MFINKNLNDYFSIIDEQNYIYEKLHNAIEKENYDLASVYSDIYFVIEERLDKIECLIFGKRIF